MPYDPIRQAKPGAPKNPLEIDLVYNVRPCGTCGFFWPENQPQQPYGPYSCYDLDSNTPEFSDPATIPAKSFVWLQGTTRTPTFPDAEVMDGCRKAPIMTIGINPNLTAFGAGTTGTSWCYPSFSSDNGTDSWTKYAYYYRYRSVYQEHFDFKFSEKYLLSEGRILATKPGVMLATTRSDDKPAYEIRVQYDGESTPTAIHLAGQLGKPVFVVPIDANQHFNKGDVLAAQLSVPAGQKVAVNDQPIGYYMQIVPVLADFEAYLKKKGHTDANLQVGEDVGQLDMVACASPHWGPQWLGDSSQAVNTIISNCVHKNAWALKQLVQTRPAILFLVGQSSWNMFHKAFGHLIQSPVKLPNFPDDGPYTLLRTMTQNDVRFKFDTKIDGVQYSISTRLVVTPHFSYNLNFLPQFRLSPDALAAFTKAQPAASEFLHKDPRFDVEKPAGGFAGFGIKQDVAGVLKEIHTKFPAAEAELKTAYYDPHQMMAGILEGMFDKGELAYTKPAAGHHGFLTRSEGPCTFCDNDHWKFPKGCPYGKPKETQYKVGFLEKVAAAIVAGAE